MSRECPIIYCEKRIPSELAMCRDHWRMVPREHGSALSAAWRVYLKWTKIFRADPNDENSKGFFDARDLHRRAMDQCVKAVDEKVIR